MDYCQEVLHLLVSEDARKSHVVEVGEWSLVEEGRVYDPSFGQAVDDQVHELGLVSAQRVLCRELTEERCQSARKTDPLSASNIAPPCAVCAGV